MTFQDKLDRFDQESEALEIKQKIERLQFAVDFWTNAEQDEEHAVAASRHRIAAEASLARVQGKK